MAGLFRRKSNHELIFWLLDRLAAFFERLAALTTDPALTLIIPNAMVVCVYKDVSREYRSMGRRGCKLYPTLRMEQDCF